MQAKALFFLANEESKNYKQNMAAHAFQKVEQACFMASKSFKTIHDTLKKVESCQESKF